MFNVDCGLLHLVRVIDRDLQASENLSLRRVFVHGQLKPGLWPALAIEGGWVIVQVQHTNRDCGHSEVSKPAVRPDLWSLDLTWRKSYTYKYILNLYWYSYYNYSQPWLLTRITHSSAVLEMKSGWCSHWCCWWRRSRRCLWPTEEETDVVR